jgi:N-acetylmuramoyl-L-alanine amidase
MHPGIVYRLFEEHRIAALQSVTQKADNSMIKVGKGGKVTTFGAIQDMSIGWHDAKPAVNPRRRTDPPVFQSLNKILPFILKINDTKCKKTMRFTTFVAVSVLMCAVQPVLAESLHIVNPPKDYSTTSPSIYFIGSVPLGGSVRVNNQTVPTSALGYFAWTTPLQVGDNAFTWAYRSGDGQEETAVRHVTRRLSRPPISKNRAFLDIQFPVTKQQVRPGEPICLQAFATPGGQLQATVQDQVLNLFEQPPQVDPADTGDLLSGTASLPPLVGLFSGCLPADEALQEANVKFSFAWQGQMIAQNAPGTITTLNPRQFTVIEVITSEAIVRSGGGSNFARLTPLPKGVRSVITGKSGDWLRIQGDGWISQKDVKVLPSGTPVPRSVVRALGTRTTAVGSELRIPLQNLLPYSVRQEEHRLVVTVWGAQSQTDIIRFVSSDPLIRSVQWEPASPEGVRYLIDLTQAHQWGYQLRYEGTTLIVTIRKAPKLSKRLTGIRVMIDPGHGGEQPGSIGFSGIAEKTVNLAIAQRLRTALQQAGATVIMTRNEDKTVSLDQRNRVLAQRLPTIFLSIHNNALPDQADPLKKYGTSVYWYQMQSRSLAQTLHDQLIKDLGSPDYGFFWDSLAVIRPAEAPAVLLELGFMTHPEEYALLNRPDYQNRIAQSVAVGLEHWIWSKTP